MCKYKQNCKFIWLQNCLEKRGYILGLNYRDPSLKKFYLVVVGIIFFLNRKAHIVLCDVINFGIGGKGEENLFKGEIFNLSLYE